MWRSHLEFNGKIRLFDGFVLLLGVPGTSELLFFSVRQPEFHSFVTLFIMHLFLLAVESRCRVDLFVKSFVLAFAFLKRCTYVSSGILNKSPLKR